MFEYLEVIDNTDHEVSYVNYTFADNKLLISTFDLRSRREVGYYEVSLDQIRDVEISIYQGWHKLKFTYNQKVFIFNYSGFGEYNYFPNKLLSKVNNRQ
ncbi:hypothetical protein COSHB9_17180 [Companilactobacillus alimentarius]|uniref:Uncharacterized protein n=1 Tax=Companilactobacillus alimentarius DSM 20249 TaxID=1423720 RepID=A0A2K9HH81_9LACO|nr:hypothetical protein [Companilactobacillus alimentarius]AUI71904.1 hypothetical protein LA20249_06830 [Companilactobacillus alimentarius DSM 20249]MDT6952429.1 hypothetical protein [Companilactobacillus alimentarius]GEO45347.1 hypothetical protein LAL01_15790 [Companilactobacillus alimentarius]